MDSTNLLTVLDGTGTIRYESPAIESILGFVQGGLVGNSIIEYIHPGDEERVSNAITEIVSREDYKVEAVDFRHEQTEGNYLWVEYVVSSNLTDKHGNAVNTLDISEIIYLVAD